MDLVNLGKGLSAEQIDAIIGPRNHLDFLNTRNVVYRQMGMKLSPPSREEALRLMSENPNLIRRPLTVMDGSLVVGFAPQKLADLVSP